MRRTGRAVRAWAGGLGLVFLAQCAQTVAGTSDDTIFEAARQGDRARVQVLVEAGADVNGLSPEGGSALHQAALSGNADLVRFLLDIGADTEVRTLRGETALHWGSSNGSVDVVRILLKAGIDVNAVNEDGETALDLAGIVEGEFPGVVKLLLSAEAKRGEDLESAAG